MKAGVGAGGRGGRRVAGGGGGGLPMNSSSQALRLSEPVWPNDKALGGCGKQRDPVRIRFGSYFSSKIVICGHCLVTSFLTNMKH